MTYDVTRVARKVHRGAQRGVRVAGGSRRFWVILYQNLFRKQGRAGKSDVRGPGMSRIGR